VVSQHAFYIQIFNPDVTVGVDQLPAALVQEVGAAVGYFLVLPGKQDFRFAAIRRSFALAGQPALQAF